MGIFLANPWGLLALATIPAIVVVHFLQERSRRVRASTLFLLERAAPTAAAGARLEKFRQSLPFWMQVLAAAIVAWLLADPRIVRRDSRQTVAVVLDSSASMEACRDRTLALLAARLPAWSATAGRTDWHLLETGPRRPPLYAGRSLAELLDVAQERWQPTLGTHDAAPALSVAASLAPAGSGAVILVTDRPQRVAEGVGVVSAGAAFDNVGFSGGDVPTVDGRPRWRALVTNHGTVPQARNVSAWLSGTGTAGDAAVGPPEDVRLEPGHSSTLEGPWPEGAARMTLRLSADRFAGDDVLPLVRPAPRRIRLAQALDGPAGDLIGRMALATENVDLVTIDQPAREPNPGSPERKRRDQRDADVQGSPAAAAAEADVVVERFHSDPETDAIQITDGPLPDNADAEDDEASPPTYDPAWISAEDHPLVNDLAWGGLLSGAAGGLSCGPADQPLLWKGQRPLVLLRHATRPGGRAVESLVLNFDVARSTAARTPAVVVMIGRFLDRVRSRTNRPWTGNVDTGQVIDVAGGPDAAAAILSFEPLTTAPIATAAMAGPVEVVPFQGRAPEKPSFFTVARGGDAEPAASGAAQFADARESDFRDAGPADTLEALRREAALKQSVEDPWTPLWLGALAAALAVAWAAGGRDATR